MISPTLPAPNLRSVLAQVPTSITMVSALIDGQPLGMVIGSFVGLSLNPPLVGISPQLTSTTWPQLRRARELGISLLTEGQRDDIRQFSGPSNQRFTNVGWHADGDAVLLTSSSVHLKVELVEEWPAGDHSFAVLRVLAASESAGASPLIFHRSRTTTVV